jgi:RHS repeat-associated protein
LDQEKDENPDGTVINTKTFVYNGNNLMTSAGDTNSGTISFGFDPLSRLTSQTDTWGFTLTNTWDAGDRLTNIQDTLPTPQGTPPWVSGMTVLTPDAANRLTNRSFTAGTAQLSVRYAYNNANQLLNVYRYSDAASTTQVGKTTYTPNPAGKPTDIVFSNAAGATIDSYHYDYLGNGWVQRETSTQGPTTKTYTYDRDGQTKDDGTMPVSINYDAVGNRNMTGYVTSPTSGNQLQTDGTWDYTYDNEGNLTDSIDHANPNGQRWKYTYDIDNRLVKAEHRPSATGAVDLRVQFAYDVLGNRISKTVDPDGDGPQPATTTNFAYDTNGNAWLDFTGNTPATITAVTRHIFGEGVDQLIARIDVRSPNTPITTWYLTDRVGSVRDVMDAAGLQTAQQIDHLDYASFGKLTYESQPGTNDRYGFQGRELDTETGLGYFRARYVNYDTGRFLSQDAAGFGAGDENLYRFVGNNPANATDPSGLITQQQFENGLNGAVDNHVPFAWIFASGYYTTGALVEVWNGNVDASVRYGERVPYVGFMYTAAYNIIASAEHTVNGDWAAADQSMESAMLAVPLVRGTWGFYRQAYEVGSLVYQGRYNDAINNTRMFGVGLMTENWLGSFFRPDVQDPELRRAMMRGGAVFQDTQLRAEIAAAVVGGMGGGGNAGGAIVGRGGGALPNVVGRGVGRAGGAAPVERLPGGIGPTAAWRTRRSDGKPSPTAQAIRRLV